MCFVGDNSFDIGETVFDRTELGAKLGVFLAQQGNALDCFLVFLGIDCASPAVLKSR